MAVVPGGAFGPSGDGHVRMCYATAYEKLEEALLRIERVRRPGSDEHGAAVPPGALPPRLGRLAVRCHTVRA